jgi:hypothetical protein
MVDHQCVKPAVPSSLVQELVTLKGIDSWVLEKLDDQLFLYLFDLILVDLDNVSEVPIIKINLTELERWLTFLTFSCYLCWCFHVWWFQITFLCNIGLASMELQTWLESLRSLSSSSQFSSDDIGHNQSSVRSCHAIFHPLDLVCLLVLSRQSASCSHSSSIGTSRSKLLHLKRWQQPKTLVGWSCFASRDLFFLL